MKKFCLLFYITVSCFAKGVAQSDVQYRVILIGDAGKINNTQEAVLKDAITKSITGKTVALFLGDNIYYRGMATSGAGKEHDINVLRSQYEGLRSAGIPVYFLPGNHDWDKSGPAGYQKMMSVNAFIASRNDSLLQVVPADACPGPEVISLSDNLVVVAMDSEWWLYPYSKHAEKSDCLCKTKRDILGRLEDIVRRNSNKTILFATHHPFVTYGTHGGYYNFKQHLFPLTDLHRSLYIPLPGIGSLYPILRKSFPPPEDLGNILYQDMKTSVNQILQQHANVIHVAGHEHTLQLIQGAILQVVSGAGSKETPVRRGKGTIYAADTSGYVVADILTDNSIRLHFFTYAGDTIKESFVFDRKYVAPKLAKAFEESNIKGDSIRMRLIPSFDSVNNFHRRMLGRNYRKIWNTETSLPLFRLSATDLTPTELGGGMQTHSLRLEDKDKKEWVIRSIDKFPDALLPQALSQTLASDLLHDNVSAIFPYAPLMVPVISNALGVPHSNPKIVYVVPDKKLGIYSRDFANKIMLLEEREPLGKSTSTIKMQAKLKDDNDNTIDQHAFLKARIQDMFLADWDRHADQWRWVDTADGKDKKYIPVPRDRDQVFYVNQGLFPNIIALPWLMPKFQGFGPRIKHVNTFNFNARNIDGIFTNALTLDDWHAATERTVQLLTDSVIEAALQKMPAPVYTSAHDELASQLKSRRQDLLRAVPRYYKFLSKDIDILFSDKNEQVTITDTLDGKLHLAVYKISKENEITKLLFDRVFDPAVTNELHLYIYGGEDRISITNNSSPIKIRVIGDGMSHKQYEFAGKGRYLKKVHVYEGDSSAVFKGDEQRVHKHISNDDANTALLLTDRYNKTIPLVAVGFNADDGIIFGAGMRWIKQGFRKTPFASSQEFIFAHSFSTNAFRLNYKGAWTDVIGNTDFVLNLNAYAPDNTRNFYGRGNASVFDKTGNFKRFYRARFDLYELNPALRWGDPQRSNFTLGPSLQFYHMDLAANQGRFITNTALLHSYDSATIGKDKGHAGIAAVYVYDNRNNILLPTGGSYFNVTWKGYTGLNTYSKSYMQLTAQLAVYKNLDRRGNFVIANRIGGGVTAGKAAFYQSLFLGGQDNLQGFRQYRFAGEHMAYNNFEARIKLANLASYVLPGQLGLVGFYDIGKVWQKGFNDAAWHQGAGGGFYFAPAQMVVLQLVAGNSGEGWYPYFMMGFRF